jgi:hypothetical protein
MDKTNRNSSSTHVVFSSLRKKFDEIKLGGLAAVVLFSTVAFGCLNPLQFVPTGEDTAVRGVSPSVGSAAAYPPLAALAVTPYEAAVGLNWNWPQEAGPGDKAVFDYAPNTTPITGRSIVGNPGGNPFSDPVVIEYPQTAIVITNLAAGAEYVVKGYVKYDTADGRYSVENEKRIRVEAIVTINPTAITGVDFRDLVRPASYTEPDYIIIAKNNPGVYAEVHWTDGITNENVWDIGRVNPDASDGRFARIIYAPRAIPKATITLHTFNSSVELADTVTVLGFDTYGIAATQTGNYTFDYVWPTTGSTTQFYVKASGGSDYNPGTSGSPMYTLNGAVRRAALERASGYFGSIAITVDGGVGDYYEHHSAPYSGVFVDIANLILQIRGVNNAVVRANSDTGIGKGEFRMFNIIDSQVGFQDIEITGGKLTVDPDNDPTTDLGGAGIYVAGSSAINGSTLTLTNVYLHGNIVQNASGGGGIMASSKATLVTITDSIISDNTTKNGLGGGGILARGIAKLTLGSGAVIENNTAFGRTDGRIPETTSGGGIKATNGSTIEMEPGSIVRGNIADRTHGGGIALYGRLDPNILTHMVMNGGRIYANQVVNTRPVSLNMGGGGLYIGDGAYADMWDGIIGGDTTGYINIFDGAFTTLYPPEGNVADVNGGGVFIDTGTPRLNMEGGEISYNSARPSKLYIGYDDGALTYSSRGGGVFVNDIDYHDDIPLTPNQRPVFALDAYTRFRMTGSNRAAIITYNFAGYGGGIYTKAVIDVKQTYYNNSVGHLDYAMVKVIENFALTSEPPVAAVTTIQSVHSYNLYVWYHSSDPYYIAMGTTNPYKFGDWYEYEQRWRAWDSFASEFYAARHFVDDALEFPNLFPNFIPRPYNDNRGGYSMPVKAGSWPQG